MAKSSSHRVPAPISSSDVRSADDEYHAISGEPGATSASLAEALGLPEPATLTAPTRAEAVDWKAARAAPGVAEAAVRGAATSLRKAAAGFGKADAQKARSRDALAGAMAGLYEAALGLLDTPELVVSLLEERAIKVSKASPMLAFVKLALPKLDQKIQSDYARVLNHGLACGLTSDQLGEAVRRLGVVELRKREAARKAAVRGKPRRPTEAEIVERFRNGRRTLAVDMIPLPEGSEMALLIVGRMNGQLRAFAFDDEPKRLMAAIRRADAAGAGLPAAGDRPVAEAA